MIPRHLIGTISIALTLLSPSTRAETAPDDAPNRFYGERRDGWHWFITPAGATIRVE